MGRQREKTAAHAGLTQQQEQRNPKTRNRNHGTSDRDAHQRDKHQTGQPPATHAHQEQQNERKQLTDGQEQQLAYRHRNGERTQRTLAKRESQQKSHAPAHQHPSHSQQRRDSQNEAPKEAHKQQPPPTQDTTERQRTQLTAPQQKTVEGEREKKGNQTPGSDGHANKLQRERRDAPQPQKGTNRERKPESDG